MQIVDKSWFHKSGRNKKNKSKKDRKRYLDVIRDSLVARRKMNKTKFKNSDPFYSSIEWRMIRGQVFCRFDHCCRCGGYFRLQIDHIKPRSRYPKLSLDINNLQVLCELCNRKKGMWDETDWRK